MSYYRLADRPYMVALAGFAQNLPEGCETFVPRLVEAVDHLKKTKSHPPTYDFLSSLEKQLREKGVLTDRQVLTGMAAIRRVEYHRLPPRKRPDYVAPPRKYGTLSCPECGREIMWRRVREPLTHVRIFRHKREDGEWCFPEHNRVIQHQEESECVPTS